MRLSGRPGTWVDVEWQADTHSIFLAFKVKAHPTRLSLSQCAHDFPGIATAPQDNLCSRVL